MKIPALILALSLHFFGLWNSLPQGLVHSITDLASATPISRPTVTLPPPGPIPVQTGTTPLSLNATGAYALDTASGTVLYANNPNTPHPIASITKLVTALVVLSRHSPSAVVTIPKLPTYQTADQTLGFEPGQQYRLSDLVTATLVYSADDGADAMALWDAGSTAKFAARMNAKMAEWGIQNAHFSNPSGLIDAGNEASPAAVAKIASLALTNSVIRQAVDQSSGQITSLEGTTYTYTTTDDLLATGQFYGIKTGYTEGAGECFVGLARINGHFVITVVLGSNNRFQTTQDLTDWIAQNWQWL